ncbi:MAG: protein translocase subunit SecF [Treponema sp.]|jgi:preprotein translocase subunit SecF|nr:protein translocase subunit SecF [Treponema sp.]
MRIIKFSKAFLPSALFSATLIIIGVVGYFVMGGFNMGVDFQAGLIQEVQFAPPAFRLTYAGQGNATVSFDRNNLYIVISGSGVEAVTHTFPYADYTDVMSLTAALSQIDGLQASSEGQADAIKTAWLVYSAQATPQLGATPFVVHYLNTSDPSIPPISIEDVRESLSALGTVSVQILGKPTDRRFMIRMQDSDISGKEEQIPADKIIATLEKSLNLGADGVAVTNSNYVGSRFSKDLSNQAGILMALTMLLILIYASIRFKPQFAIGAVLAIAHDALVMVAFIAWTRMEFNTTSIAAILTILGYSINDTIVIFDRVRETRRMFPEDSFVDVLDRSISETLGRTIITTMTTMLAVLSLFIFTTGSMKDFAFALLIGMMSGVYSTIFIACGFVNFWDIVTKNKREKLRGGTRKLAKA